jgi:hypothetical protein
VRDTKGYRSHRDDRAAEDHETRCENRGRFRIDARLSFDAVRHPAGSPGVFEQPDRAKDVFLFARAAELNAEDVDFDKLIAREKAIADENSEEGEGRNASQAT